MFPLVTQRMPSSQAHGLLLSCISEMSGRLRGDLDFRTKHLEFTCIWLPLFLTDGFNGLLSNEKAHRINCIRLCLSMNSN